MAKYTPKSVLAGFNLTTINSNFTDIATELNTRVAYRDNPVGEPNQWETQQDANSSRLINLLDAVSPSEPATLRQLTALGSGTTAGVLKIAYIATAGQTVFAAPGYVQGANNLGVYINGVRQAGAAYVETSPTSVTLSAGVDSGDSVEVIVNEQTDLPGVISASSVSFKGGTLDNMMVETTTAALNDIGASINTSGKNSSMLLIADGSGVVRATGASPSDVWVDMLGATTHTPV